MTVHTHQELKLGQCVYIFGETVSPGQNALHRWGVDKPCPQAEQQGEKPYPDAQGDKAKLGADGAEDATEKTPGRLQLRQRGYRLAKTLPSRRFRHRRQQILLCQTIFHSKISAAFPWEENAAESLVSKQKVGLVYHLMKGLSNESFCGKM